MFTGLQEAFTLALMGQIDVEKSVFPYNKVGNNLDILARRYLYEAGLEYRHGTGHGIGLFLAIHECKGLLFHYFFKLFLALNRCAIYIFINTRFFMKIILANMILIFAQNLRTN